MKMQWDWACVCFAGTLSVGHIKVLPSNEIGHGLSFFPIHWQSLPHAFLFVFISVIFPIFLVSLHFLILFHAFVVFSC
jgi:hypothetical protein